MEKKCHVTIVFLFVSYYNLFSVLIWFVEWSVGWFKWWPHLYVSVCVCVYQWYKKNIIQHNFDTYYTGEILPPSYNTDPVVFFFHHYTRNDFIHFISNSDRKKNHGYISGKNPNAMKKNHHQILNDKYTCTHWSFE